MFPERFTSLVFYQKKKNILLYRAADETRKYVLKSIITKDAAVRQAFYDEYESLCCLNSPSLPVYYGISEDFSSTVTGTSSSKSFAMSFQKRFCGWP